MSTSGRRCPEDERALLAELGRYIHLARTDIRQQKIIRKAAAAVTHADPQPPVAEEAPKGETPRRRVRKSSAASSIWMTFKASVARMLPKSHAKAVKEAEFRRARSVTVRATAVANAEAYFASALTQAKDAGLEEDATEEYLAEQQAAAAKLLRRVPLGSHITDLAQASAMSHRLVTEQVPDNAEQRKQLAECIVRERVLLGDVADEALADPLEEADVFLHKAATRVVHDEKKLVHDSGVLVDVVPTQCIIRIKNSGRRKQTAFLCSQKAAASFKTSFAALLKKDVAPLLKHQKEEIAADDKKAKKAPVPVPKSNAGGKKK
jgi:hypothetical protein